MAQTSTMTDLAPGWEGARRLSSLQLEVTQVVRKLCEGVHAFIMLGSITDRQTLKANIHPRLLFSTFMQTNLPNPHCSIPLYTHACKFGICIYLRSQDCFTATYMGEA